MIVRPPNASRPKRWRTPEHHRPAAGAVGPARRARRPPARAGAAHADARAAHAVGRGLDGRRRVAPPAGIRRPRGGMPRRPRAGRNHRREHARQARPAGPRRGPAARQGLHPPLRGPAGRARALRARMRRQRHRARRRHRGPAGAGALLRHHDDLGRRTDGIVAPLVDGGHWMVRARGQPDFGVRGRESGRPARAGRAGQAHRA